jgi:Zn-finger nucleic acid-binding protein
MTTATCPRCSAGIAAADDVGAGVGRCGGCGCYLCTGDARAHLIRWLGVDERVWNDLVLHGRRGPACTLCSGRGTMQTFPLKGITVDGCGDCGALLLDPGELSKLTGLAEAPSPSSSSSSSSSSHIAAPEPIADIRPDTSALGRVYAAPDVALDNFVGTVSWVELAQHRQHLESCLSLEFGNRYVVRTPQGSGSLVVDEGVASALARMFLGGLLRSRYTLRDASDTPVLTLVRSFEKLVLSRMDVALWSMNDDGRALGSVERSFRVASSAYELVDARGRCFARLERPTLSLWQFRLQNERGDVVGAIAKQWADLATEWFTDADDFSIDFGATPWTPAQRAVIVAAALAIDLDHFERPAGRNRGLGDLLR